MKNAAVVQKWEELRSGDLVSVHTRTGARFHAVVDDLDAEGRFLWIRRRGQADRKLIHKLDGIRLLPLSSGHAQGARLRS
ncbi:hypothetical protein [Glutamicibacter sp.]|uniref:hypothetical protein n=1 Tax=Glutamicibacter sp. TaxID=1931995 RepID=UPI0028BEB4E2|nr:hypothetical protein [Glutamicibacter sp.]